MEGKAAAVKAARPAIDMAPSPALSLIKKAPKTIAGRKIGVLVADGTDADVVASLKRAVEKAGARLQVVAPKIGGARGKGGKRIEADHQLAGGPSVIFDAVVVAVSDEGAALLSGEAAAIDWIRDAFNHLKVIGVTDAAAPLLDRAGVGHDEGIVSLESAKGAGAFVAAAQRGRIWDREPAVSAPK